MIIGVGIDIVDLDEFRAQLSDALVDDTFLPSEIEYSRARARPWESFAARFAAKEAAMKALGAGIADGIRWHDVEVVRAPSGGVGLRLSGKALEVARERGVSSLRLSMAHSRAHAVAIVVCEGVAD